MKKLMSFFFERGIVGVEFNSDGLRIQSLSDYVRKKFKDVPEITFWACLSPSADQTFEQFAGIRGFRIQVHKEKIGMFNNTDKNIVLAFDSMRKCSDAPKIAIECLDESNSKSKFATKTPDLINAVLSSPDALEAADQFKVYARDKRTSKLEWFDMVRDQIASKRLMVKSDGEHRVLKSESVFEQIIAAESELHESLKTCKILAPKYEDKKPK